MAEPKGKIQFPFSRTSKLSRMLVQWATARDQNGRHIIPR